MSGRVIIDDKYVGGVKTRSITIETGSSEFAVIAVQEMVSKKGAATTRKPYIGALKGVKTWREVILNGERHTLTLEGMLEDDIPVMLVIHSMGAGFQGSGPLNAVTILTTLRVGERQFLRDIITRPPNGGRPNEDSWRAVYDTHDLMPHGPQRG